MNRPAVNLPPARSWHDLPQPIKPRAMSREGRRRRVLAASRLAGLTGALLLAIGGGVMLISTLKKNPGGLLAPADGAPFRKLVVRTDAGTLDEAWVRETLGLPPKAGLMTLDLAALQRRLLVSGQARMAELTRQFPDTLVVTLQERVAVARVLAQADDGVPQTLLVARDGVVFAGTSRATEAAERLPFLDGVRLVRAGAGLAPIEGMTAVAGLLEAAQANVPELARGFRVVSLARLAADGVIVVKSDDVGEVVFGTRGEYWRQLARLDYTLAEVRRQFPAEPLRVNLAIGDLAAGGGQVLVARLLAEVPAVRAAPPRPVAERPAVPALFFPPPKSSTNFSHAL